MKYCNNPHAKCNTFRCSSFGLPNDFCFHIGACPHPEEEKLYPYQEEHLKQFVGRVSRERFQCDNCGKAIDTTTTFGIKDHPDKTFCSMKCVNNFLEERYRPTDNSIPEISEACGRGLTFGRDWRHCESQAEYILNGIYYFDKIAGFSRGVIDMLPEMARIAKASAQKSGEDVSKMLEDIIVASGRRSIMILDNLGISSADAAKYQEECSFKFSDGACDIQFKCWERYRILTK